MNGGDPLRDHEKFIYYFIIEIKKDRRRKGFNYLRECCCPLLVDVQGAGYDDDDDDDDDDASR